MCDTSLEFFFSRVINDFNFRWAKKNHYIHVPKVRVFNCKCWISNLFENQKININLTDLTLLAACNIANVKNQIELNHSTSKKTVESLCMWKEKRVASKRLIFFRFVCQTQYSFNIKHKFSSMFWIKWKNAHLPEIVFHGFYIGLKFSKEQTHQTQCVRTEE